MSWSTTEHQTIKHIQRNVSDLVNAIKGDLKKPDEPGMAETLRTVQGHLYTFQEQYQVNETRHANTHKGLKRFLAGVGFLAMIGVLLDWNFAARLIMGMLEVIVRWVS